jgi:acetylglutamate kinase
MMRVIKIGGNELQLPGFIDDLAQTLAKLGEPTCIVHGGGKEIDELQLRLGQQPIKIQGLRHTDTNALNAAMMILCGLVSKRLVAGLMNAGVNAMGLSGVDGGILRVQKYRHSDLDLGFVGEMVSVREDLLILLISHGITPVISPICLGEDGQIYNVNADEAASFIAISIHAESIDFVSNVPGVMAGTELLHSITESESERLILQGAITSGMIPKVRSAFKAFNGGVRDVRIVDLEHLIQPGGTRFTHKTSRSTSETIQILMGGAQ